MWTLRGVTDGSLLAQHVTLAPDKCNLSGLHAYVILQLTTKARFL